MTIYCLDTNDDISPVKVMVVVSERTNRPENLLASRSRVPTGFELDTFRFHTTALEETFHVDWENLTHDENTPLWLGLRA